MFTHQGVILLSDPIKIMAPPSSESINHGLLTI